MDKPEYGKQYRLTGSSEKASILRGDSWADSEVARHTIARGFDPQALEAFDEQAGRARLDPVFFLDRVLGHLDRRLDTVMGKCWRDGIMSAHATISRVADEVYKADKAARP